MCRSGCRPVTRPDAACSWRGTRSRIEYEPRGVVLIMAAWNFPFALLIAPLVPAIAAGNCAILRPSEKVPATNRVVARILAETFDESEVAMVEGGPAVADALLALPFDHIFFTGSTKIGRVVMAAAARTLASVTLELGGKSPALVDETADIELAAERIAWGKFSSSGQACVAPDYALVHRSRAPAFVAATKRVVARFFGENEDAGAASPDMRTRRGSSLGRTIGAIDRRRGAAAARSWNAVDVGRGDDDTSRRRFSRASPTMPRSCWTRSSDLCCRC